MSSPARTRLRRQARRAATAAKRSEQEQPFVLTEYGEGFQAYLRRSKKRPEAALWREHEARGNAAAMRVQSRADLQEWLQTLLLDEDPSALAFYEAEALKALGEGPLDERPHDWPVELGSTYGRIEIEQPGIRGWRMWAVQDGALFAPFLTAGRFLPRNEDARWRRGINTSTHRYCSPETVGHPAAQSGCVCGIRAMQSLTALGRFSDNMRFNARTAPAIAEVRLWGRVAGPAIGDDWPFTARGEHAQIEGPIYIPTSLADTADDLRSRYGVEVEVGGPTTDYVEQLAA
ncbi:MAG: hypothetical protein PGN15_09790 [Aeromicrobium erythreum]